MKTHTGDQKHTCPNPGCGRKLASKRGLEIHPETCQKEKTLFCTHKNCNKLFATQAGLTATARHTESCTRMPAHAKVVEKVALPGKRVWMTITEPEVEIQTG